MRRNCESSGFHYFRKGWEGFGKRKDTSSKCGGQIRKGGVSIKK